MQFQDIFNEYYTQFRGDSDIPAVNDFEWIIAARYANTALRRLENVDAEDWEWLWTDTQTSGDTQTWSSTSNEPVTLDFSCPSDMVKPGGWITFTAPTASSGSFKVDVVSPYAVQYQTSDTYAYFTGDPQTGFTLHVRLSGNSYSGYSIDFPYYRRLTYFNTTSDGNGGILEDGTTVTECPDPNFLINYMLAWRFRATRNFPAYQTAKADAEEALKGMQLKNRKGVEGHPWNSLEGSSGIFGV